MSVPDSDYEAAGQQVYTGQPAAFAAGPGPGLFGGGRGKPFFLTSEFLVLTATIAALLIAAAVADNFDAPLAWTLVTVAVAAYILSRGLAKSGRGGRD